MVDQENIMTLDVPMNVLGERPKRACRKNVLKLQLQEDPRYKGMPKLQKEEPREYVMPLSILIENNQLEITSAKKNSNLREIPSPEPEMPELSPQINIKVDSNGYDFWAPRQHQQETPISTVLTDFGQDCWKTPSMGQLPVLTPRPTQVQCKNKFGFESIMSSTMPVLTPAPQTNIFESVQNVLFRPVTPISPAGSGSTISDFGDRSLSDDLSPSASSSSDTSPSFKLGKVTKSHKKVPLGGQISLRSYYYGKWNWGEEQIPVIVVKARKRKRNYKSQFENEILQCKNWNMDMSSFVQCTLCPAKIANNTKVIPHMMEHIVEVEENRWELVKMADEPKMVELLNQCRLCFTKCTSLISSHMKKTHQHVADICCRICEIAFDTEDDMMIHHKKFHDFAEMPYVCPLCDCRSSFRWDIVQHFQNNHGSMQFVMCPFCIKLFDVSAEAGSEILQKHLLIHKTEPELDCPRCSLKFVDKSDLEMHLLFSHTIPAEMNDAIFHDKKWGYQCYKEEVKRQPIIINRPNRS